MENKIIIKLKEDFKNSMLEKDNIRKNIIQMIRSNIQNFIRDNKLTEQTISEEDINMIISRELKQQKDSLEAFEKGNRDDLASETKLKIEIIEGYLPEQLSEEDILNIIKETLLELGIDKATGKDRGKLMKSLMPKFKGKADGKLVNKIVEDISK